MHIKKRYREVGHLLEVVFQYHPVIVKQIKSIEGKRFNPNTRIWTIPKTPENIAQLEQWGFENRNAAKKQYKPIPIQPKHLKRQLYPFQQEGVGFLEEHNGRGLIADEPGLGKTIQALAWTVLHYELSPVLIVCPATLKYTWEEEIRLTMHNPTIHVIEGRTIYKLPNAHYYIINYDILADWVKHIPMKILIADEVHYAKNWSAKRTKALLRQAWKRIPFIALTGTPVINKPIEFYLLLRALDTTKTYIPTKIEYGKEYCDGFMGKNGWDFSGASNMKQLHELINGRFMLRRKKKDVLKDLPEKTYATTILPLHKRKEYDLIEEDYIEWLRQNHKKASHANQLTKIAELRKKVAELKLPAVIEWVDNFLLSEKKIVLMAVHRFVIDALMQYYNGMIVKIDGSVAKKKRKQVERQFQEDPTIRIFIGNIKAAGEGITLTAASDVAFIEFPWTPGMLLQAMDRVHRIGQKDGVVVHYLVGQRTIDEKMIKLLDKKLRIITQIMDGEDVKEGESILQSLVNAYF